MKKVTLKNLPLELRLFSRRVFILFLILTLAIVILILRLVWLQILQHKTYVTLSDQNQMSLVPIEPKRGLIFDRHGVLLAENIPVYSLDVIPTLHGKSMRNLLENLNQLIPISANENRLFYHHLKQKRRFQEVPLKTQLTEEEMARFLINQYRFPGVVIKARLIRH